jgi:hypothetical protein
MAIHSGIRTQHRTETPFPQVLCLQVISSQQPREEIMQLLDLELLRQRLGQFGLNPLHWCVEIRARRGTLMQMEICSIRDAQMRFEGWAENENWLSLAYCEI